MMNYIYISAFIMALACESEEGIDSQGVQQQGQQASNSYDPFGNGVANPIDDGSSGFYDYNSAVTPPANTAGAQTNTQVDGTTPAVSQPTTTTNNTASNNGDLFASEVSQCNSQNKFYIRSRDLKVGRDSSGCAQGIRISNNYPCTLDGFVAEAKKFNVSLGSATIADLSANYTANQCGYGASNKPVALFVNSNYSDERYLSVR